MPLHIRPETSDDHPAVFTLLEQAFRDEPYSDHQEQFLVERLRKSDAFIPKLSLVGEVDGQLVGYILLTKIQIRNETQAFESLALAPVAVLPSHQKQGIGGQLIEAARAAARNLGFGSIVLLGHAGYYPRFGYQRAEFFGISLPFDVPPDNCMAIELVPGALDGVSGMVVYPKEFEG